MPFRFHSARTFHLSRPRFDLMVAHGTMQTCTFASVLLSLVITAAMPQAMAQSAGGNEPALTGPCAQTNDPARQLDLALRFAAGRDVPKDDAMARRCLAAAAAAGSERAQLELGLYLLQGKGGPVDVPEARHWLERAAAAGSQAAAHLLAEIQQPRTRTEA